MAHYAKEALFQTNLHSFTTDLEEAQSWKFSLSKAFVEPTMAKYLEVGKCSWEHFGTVGTDIGLRTFTCNQFQYFGFCLKIVFCNFPLTVAKSLFLSPLLPDLSFVFCFHLTFYCLDQAFPTNSLDSSWRKGFKLVVKFTTSQDFQLMYIYLPEDKNTLCWRTEDASQVFLTDLTNPTPPKFAQKGRSPEKMVINLFIVSTFLQINRQ